MKISEPAAAPSKPPPDVSTSMAAKHEEEYPHEEETAEERAKREAELQKIYADLAKEDDRYLSEHLGSGQCLHSSHTHGPADILKVANVFASCKLNNVQCFS